MGKRTFENILIKMLVNYREINKHLEVIKKYYSYDKYDICLDLMYKNKYFSKELNNFSKVLNINDIFLESTYPILLLNNDYNSSYFYKDFVFLLKVLQKNAKYIYEFNQLRNCFEKNYLLGKFPDALKNLDDVKEKCGLSYWYIESKLLILNEMNYHQYNSYYLDLKEKIQDEIIRDYIRLLKRKVNLRLRQRDFKTFFIDNFEMISEKQEFTQIFVDYIEFMQFEQLNKLNDEKKRNLCIMAYHLTIVDSFLLCKKIIDYLQGYEILDSMIESVFTDFRNVFFKKELERGKIINNIKKLFCENVNQCINQCVKELFIYPENFEILDVYVKSIFITSSPIQFSDLPLGKIINVLVGCYQKIDEVEYAVNCIDMCERYLRALTSFSSYYELLNIASDRILKYGILKEFFYKIKILNRRYLCPESYFYYEYPNEYLVKLHNLYEKSYVCDWNICLRKKIKVVEGIEIDEILSKIIDIDSNYTICSQEDGQDIQKLYFEEYIIDKFENALDNLNFIQAIHIYISAYIKRKFLVLRMDINKLNDNLPEFKCVPFLSDIDFFLYANITELNKCYEDIISQTVIDSFASVLISRGIKKPTNIIRKGEIPSIRILMFLEFVCNDILNQAPCDLYDAEMLLEQIRILKILNNYKQERKYQEWLLRIEQEYEYLQIQDKINYKNLTTEKIIADWLQIELDNNILTIWQQLKNYSIEKIITDEQVLSEFKDLFVVCKKDYIKKVNSQMGVTIRHGILESEFVQLFKKYNLFIPKYDENEKDRIKQENLYLVDFDKDEKEEILNKLQNICLDFFEKIEEIKQKYIFFTHKEHYKNYTSMYVSLEEIKENILLINDISTEGKFIYEIKKILDNILSNRLLLMKKNVIEQLQILCSSYYKDVCKSLIYTNSKNKNMLKNFEEELEKTIFKIGNWFYLSHNGRRLCDINDINKCISEIKVYYNDIKFKFDYSKDVQLTLNTLIWIECIIKNIVNNIEKHSGYSMRLVDANSIISIHIFSDNAKKIRIFSHNKIKVYTKNKKERINKINSMIYDLKSSCINDIDERHGFGYTRIAMILLNNFDNPKLKAELNKNYFEITITFECRGGI